MTFSATTSPTANDAVISDNRASRWASVLLLGQFAGMWAAFFILAQAINWPASLRLPPSDILPLIREQSSAVFLGYLSYFIHALLLIPIAAMMPKVLGLDEVGGRISMLFGGLAGFAKALGIIRWIVLMPGLAIAFTAPSVDTATQNTISIVYEAFNTYAGGVGEVLGVALFAGLWTLIISSALVISGSRFIGWAGVVAGVLLLGTLSSVIGVESPVLLTVSGIFWQLWTLALAIKLWRRA